MNKKLHNPSTFISVTLSNSLESFSLMPLPLKFSILFLFFLVHIDFALKYRDFGIMAAFGGLITIFGLLLLFQYTYPTSTAGVAPPKVTVKLQEGRYSSIPSDGRMSIILSEAKALEEISIYNQRLVTYDEYLKNKRIRVTSSFALTIFGTFIWAYAGYLNALFLSLDTCT